MSSIQPQSLCPARVFLAGPLSTAEQRLFNELVAKALMPRFDVFLPQRDVGLMTDLLKKPGWTEEATRQFIFDSDLDGLKSSDCVLAILEAPFVSGGVASELGIAFSMQIICVGLYSPRRTAEGGFHNPIIDSMLMRVFNDLDNLVDSLAWLEDTIHLHSLPIISR